MGGLLGLWEVYQSCGRGTRAVGGVFTRPGGVVNGKGVGLGPYSLH